MCTAISSQEVLSSANSILRESGLADTDLVNITQCNSSVLSKLYEGLTNHELPGRVNGVWSCIFVDEGSRCQHVINCVVKLLPPEITLNHISGQDIANGDLLSIKNILDILSILYNVPHPSLRDHHGYDASYNDSDSNLITEGGMQVINEVLEEELDSTHSSLEDHPHGSPHRPITIPSGSQHASNTDTTTDTLLSITTPPKYPHKLTTPIHSTPRKGLSSAQGDSTNSNDIRTFSLSNTPPLSISTLSTDTRLTVPTLPLTPQQPVAVMDSTTQTEPMNEHTVEDTTVHVEETNNEREGPRETSTIARDSIIERIVDNYQQTNRGRDKKKRSEKKTSKYPSKCSVHTSTKIKGKHSPRLGRRSVNTLGTDKHQGLTKNPQNCEEMIVDQKINQRVLTCVEEAMPGISLSPSTIRKYWSIEFNQLKAKASYRGEPPNPMRKKVNDVERRHSALVEVLRKDLDHTRRRQMLLEEKLQRNALQSMIRNQRHATVRAKRYFKDYELAIRSKLQNRRTKEQKVFREAYEDCLAIMKEKVIEMKRFAKEKQLVEVKKYEAQLESMETYYKDQLQMLSEAIKEDEKNTKLRDKAHQQDAKKVERELRKTMEANITKLWAGLDEWEDTCAHFRELDKETLKKRLTIS